MIFILEINVRERVVVGEPDSVWISLVGGKKAAVEIGDLATSFCEFASLILV